MRIALCVKNKLFAECLGHFLSDRGSYEIVALESTINECLKAAKSGRAELVMVDASSVDDRSKNVLFGARLVADLRLVLLNSPLEFASEPEWDLVIQPDTDGTALLKILGSGTARVDAAPVPSLARVKEVNPPKRGRGRPPRKEGTLSRREYEIASLIQMGMTNRQIADELGLVEQSVKNTVHRIMGALKCHNRTEIAKRVEMSAASLRG